MALEQRDVWFALCYLAILIPIPVFVLRYNIFLVLGILSCAALLIPVRGKEVRAWYLPVTLFKDRRIKKKRKGTVWEKKDLGQKGSSLIPLTIYGIPESGISLVHNSLSETVGFIIIGEGSGIASASYYDQKAEQDKVGEMVKKAAVVAKRPVYINFLVRSRPEDHWTYWNEINRRGDPGVVLPEALEKRDEDLTPFDLRMLKLKEIQMAAIQVIDACNDVDMAMIVTIDTTTQMRRAIDKRKLTTALYEKDPIRKVMDSMATQLMDTTQGTAHVLGLEDAERFLKKGLKVTNLQSYYDRAHKRYLQEDVITPDQWYPQEKVESGEYWVNIDGTYHAVMKLMNFPYEEAPPFVARAFYSAGAKWHCSVTLSETVKGSREAFVSGRTRSLQRQAVALAGPDENFEEETREEKYVKRRREIRDSRYTTAHQPYKVISATSLEELDRQITVEELMMSGVDMEIVLVKGESITFDLIVTCVTGFDVRR
jgi:hypothetical protein